MVLRACGPVDRAALSLDAGGFHRPDTGDRCWRLGHWPRFGWRALSRREAIGQRGPPRTGGVGLDLLDLDQGRERLADLVGHLRQAVDVLLQVRPLAPAIALGELPGQLVEAAIVAGTG